MEKVGWRKERALERQCEIKGLTEHHSEVHFYLRTSIHVQGHLAICLLINHALSVKGQGNMCVYVSVCFPLNMGNSTSIAVTVFLAKCSGDQTLAFLTFSSGVRFRKSSSSGESTLTSVLLVVLYSVISLLPICKFITRRIGSSEI